MTTRLLEELDVSSESKPLKCLHLSGMDMNSRDIIYYLLSILRYNHKLEDFTLSNCNLKGTHLEEILETLVGEYEEGTNDPQIRSLNVSYNSLGSESEGIAERVAEHISQIINKSTCLTHLDLSGMSLKDNIKPIIEAINESKHQILIGLHLHDNNFNIETQDWILKKMGVEAHNYHRL